MVITMGRKKVVPFAFDVAFDGITIRSTNQVKLSADAVGTVGVARTPVSLTVDNGVITIPGDLVGLQDRAIETVARLMAINEQTSYEVASTMPYLGFAADDLESLAGLTVDVPVTTGRAVPIIKSDIARMDANALMDRLAGMSYLAEALNATSPIGQYSQLVRLFESGFATAIRDVQGLLTTFLADTSYRFTAEEVAAWLSARGRSLHADNPTRQYLLSGDVARYVGRMLEAGYDLLLNKETWGTPDAGRRDQWRPPYGSANANGGSFVTRGHDWKHGLQLLDMFGAFPMIMNSGWPLVLPRGAWITGGADGGTTEILGDWVDDESATPPPK